MPLMLRCVNHKDPECPHAGAGGYGEDRHMVLVTRDEQAAIICTDCYVRLWPPADEAAGVLANHAAAAG